MYKCKLYMWFVLKDEKKIIHCTYQYKLGHVLYFYFTKLFDEPFRYKCTCRRIKQNNPSAIFFFKTNLAKIKNYKKIISLGM